MLTKKTMKRIEVEELKDNFFEAIGKEWMLITAGQKDKFNQMTASWGCTGWLWNKPVAVVFVRPERYTHTLMERQDCVTLAFLGDSPETRRAYNFCGSKSGRDHDKAAETGLRPVTTALGNITYEQARLTLECRKLYKDSIKPENFIDPGLSKWYGAAHGGYHDMYVLEIVNAYVNEE